MSTLAAAVTIRNTMNDKPQEELLTAYLDDELAPEERADVERMLAEDAASRQLFEELKALRSTLQALPQERLEADFSKKVMQLAERSMLVGPSPGDGQASPSTLQQTPAPKVEVRSTSDQDWTRRMLRPLAFAGMAIAAALAVMVLQPDELANQDAARGIAREDREERVPALEATPSTGGVESMHEGTRHSIAGDEPAIRAPSSSQPKAAMWKGGGGRSAMDAETPGEADMRDADHGPTAIGGQDATAAPDVRALNFNRSKELVSEQSLFQSNAAAPVYSVQLDVTPEAVRGRALDKTLERNRIKVTPTAAQRANVDEAIEGKPIQGIAPIDVVYVELTKSQLESVLTDIADQPDQFSNIMVPTNSAFVGQKTGAGEAQQWQFGQQNALQRGDDVAKPLTDTYGSEPESDGGVASETSRQEVAPEGVAQRIQLPQISPQQQTMGLEVEEAASPQSAESKPDRQKDEAQTKPDEGDDQAGGFDLEFLGGGDGDVLNEQMFRALFILRVVPETNEAATETEPPAEPAPAEPKSE